MQVNFPININNTAFSGRLDISKKMSQFTTSLLKLPDNDIINLRKVEKVAREYIPGIKIQNFKDKKAINQGTYALCGTCCKKKGKFFDFNSIGVKLFVIKFSKKGKFDAIDYLASIIHEMTHAFQHTDKTQSYYKLYNDYLKKHSLKDFSNNENLFIGKMQIFKYVDNLVKKLEKTKHPSMTESGPLYKYNYKKLLPDKKMVQEYFEKEIVKDLRKLKKQKIPFDWKFLQKTMRQNAINECNAYKEQQKVVSLFTDEIDFGAKLFDYIFSNLSNVIKKINADKI